MIDADSLRTYFSGRDLYALIRQLKRGELDDPISEQLALGLKQVVSERDIECFTLTDTWRFATRNVAARSRLIFLSEHGPYDRIIDASCGIGLMLRELASLKPETLIGFEIDPVSAELARANLKLFSIDAQVRVIDSTSAEALGLITSADLVFCDPERVAHAHTRTLDESTPSFSLLSSHARRLAYETSPRLPVEALPGVVELYSERRRHARTTLYLGFGAPLRRVVSDRSEVLSGTPAPLRSTPIGSGAFVELLDPTIVKAGLGYLLGDWHEASTKYLRLTDSPEPGPFIDAYRIIERGDLAALRAAAVELSDFNRIALRYPVPPGAYWREANAIRKSSNGSRTIHVFKLETEYLLTEPIP